MAIPELPWYGALKRVVAPTEAVSNAALIIIAIVTLLILIKGDAVVKAAWAVYVVSP